MPEFINILNAFSLLSNFVIIPAISYGSQLALGALGITLIFGILRFANFAHGDLMAFGTMITILFTWWFQSLGISLGIFPTAILALPFAIIITAIFTILIEKTVFKFSQTIDLIFFILIILPLQRRVIFRQIKILKL